MSNGSIYQLTEEELKATEIVRNALDARGGLPAAGPDVSPTTAAALKYLNLFSSSSHPKSSAKAPQAVPNQLSPTRSAVGNLLPRPPFTLSQYKPPQARPFTSSEIENRAHKLTRETKASRIVQHPIDAIVEYPETGTSGEEIVFHHFAGDPTSDVHPKDNIQYSMGASHGSSGTHRKQYCNWLTPNRQPGSQETRCECNEPVVSCSCLLISSAVVHVLIIPFQAKGSNLASSGRQLPTYSRTPI